MDGGSYNSPGLPGAAAELALRLYARVALSGRGSYRLVRLARRMIRRAAWVREFKVPGGLRYRLDLAEFPDCCMAYGLFERETERVINRLLRRGDHFVDGGANIGYFSLKAARRVGPEGRVDAFEPQPLNRARLLANIAANALEGQIHVHEEALFAAAGDAVIHTYLPEARMNHGTATLLPPPGALTRATPIRTARMDQLLSGMAPRLVKLDIEGAEPMAIAGMSGILRNPSPPAIIFEWGEHAIPVGYEPMGAVGELLKVAPDYRFYVIGARLRRIEPLPEVLSGVHHVNLLAITPAHDGHGLVMVR